MSYKGGKNGSGTYQKIINQIPPHARFIEAFCGSAAITRYKRPAASTICVDSDPQVVDMVQALRVPGLTVVCDDATSYLQHFKWLAPKGGEFVYVDPPYLGETRSYKKPIYRHEMMDEESHARLLAVLKSLPCNVMISGYWSELYERELEGWRSISFEAVTRGGWMATEYCWMNYPEPLELHDYRYLGENYRERERIKRLQSRWRRRLADMPKLERMALIQEMDALKAGTSPSSNATV